MVGTTRLDFQPISLRGGWSGRVLVGMDGALPEGVATADLPTFEQWRTLLEPLVVDPSALPGYEVLKYSAAGEVFRAELAWGDGSIDVVCKQTRIRGLRRRLLATLRATRERTNFDRALTVLRAGIATALPLALLGGPGPKREAWLVTAFVPGVVDLDQVALTLLARLEPDRRRAVKNAIIEAVVDLLAGMERHRLHHRDLKASNILLTNWGGSAGDMQVWIMDLEGLGRRRAWESNRRWQPLVRLAASLIGYAALTRGDYARLLRAYLARVGLPQDSWRQHYRVLSRRAADYARRSRLRKTHKLDGYGGDG